MGQANFAYECAGDAPGLQFSLSVFADRVHVREQMREDAEAAGLLLRECGEVSALLEGEPRPLGDLVLLDCPRPSGRALAAIARLDMRAARSGAHLVISTQVDALDDVFACCDQSNPQILVDPSRADRVIALGRALARLPNLRVNELNEADRMTLLRLTEQVGQIAHRLEQFGADQPAIMGEGLAFRLESPVPGFSPAPRQGVEARTKSVRAPLPDPRLVRRMIRQRQLRARFFDRDLFADPAWDILLDLTAARAEHIRVSVTSLCIASGVPPTTALRWIGQLTEAGLLQRVEDESDRRRAFIALTDRAADGMARYFAEIDRSALQLS